jgi:hypothetical protein
MTASIRTLPGEGSVTHRQSCHANCMTFGRCVAAKIGAVIR